MPVAQAAEKDKWSALHYNTQASFVYSKAYAAPILDLLDAQSGEKIYDFGCGSGDLSVQIAETVGKSGRVVGVDYSESMVSMSCRRYIHLSGSDQNHTRSRRPARMACNMLSFRMHRTFNFRTISRKN